MSWCFSILKFVSFLSGGCSLFLSFFLSSSFLHMNDFRGLCKISTFVSNWLETSGADNLLPAGESDARWIQADKPSLRVLLCI